MGAKRRKIAEFMGVDIYQSAPTHPNCKTRALIIKEGKITKRFRYIANSFSDKIRVLNEVKKYIKY